MEAAVTSRGAELATTAHSPSVRSFRTPGTCCRAGAVQNVHSLRHKQELSDGHLTTERTGLCHYTSRDYEVVQAVCVSVHRHEKTEIVKVEIGIFFHLLDGLFNKTYTTK